MRPVVLKMLYASDTSRCLEVLVVLLGTICSRRCWACVIRVESDSAGSAGPSHSQRRGVSYWNARHVLPSVYVVAIGCSQLEIVLP